MDSGEAAPARPADPALRPAGQVRRRPGRRRLPPNVEQADLVSYGIFGLIDAIEKFDPDRAVKFESYAISRIRGAIIDELRAIDWIPRSVRTKARGSSGRTPSSRPSCTARRPRTRSPRSSTWRRGPAHDLQPALLGQRRRARRAARRRRRRRLALPGRHARGHHAERPAAGRARRGAKSCCPRRRAAARAREDRRHPLLLRGPHPRRDRSVLGVTESRICQMHTKAVLHLRAKLADSA